VGCDGTSPADPHVACVVSNAYRRRKIRNYEGNGSPRSRNAIAEIARRHGLSREAVLALVFAIHAGGGTMAQFSIPELGGSGQWMKGRDDAGRRQHVRAVLRCAAWERGGPLPSIDEADAVLDERRKLAEWA
jgi:hypothetical protein